MKSFLLGSILSIVTCFSLPHTEKLYGEDLDHQFYGRHFIITFKDCDVDAMNNIDGLKAAFLQGIKDAGATCLGTCDYTFDPHGFTMIALLSESHASIHTYPEYGSCFIDVFTCGTNCKNELFEQSIAQYLNPGTTERVYLERK